MAGIENIRKNSNFQGVARTLSRRLSVYIAGMKIGYLNKERPAAEDLLALMLTSMNNSELVSDTCHNVLTMQVYVIPFIRTLKTFRLDVAVAQIKGEIVINLEAQSCPNLPDKRGHRIC